MSDETDGEDPSRVTHHSSLPTLLRGPGHKLQ
jgi:hypothetical protein